MEPTNLLPPDLNGPVNNSPGLTPAPPQPEENFSEKHGWYRALQEKGILLPSLLIIILPILFVSIVYRYDIYGLFKNQNYSIEVIDPGNSQPLSNAKVTLRGVTLNTNNYGVVTFLKIKVGHAPIYISKLYYHNYSGTTLVTFTDHKAHVFGIGAAAAEVKMSVVNRITQQPIQGVLISTAANNAVTNTNGQAYMSLPPSSVPIPATTLVNKYNASSVLINVLSPNNISLVPSGKVYYLANPSGPVSLVSSNLDGTNPATVIPGGSSANASNSQVMYSHDSNFVAVSMPASSGVPTLNIYNTKTGKTINLGQSSSGITLNGWTHDNILVYTLIANNVGDESGGSVIYGYNAASAAKPYRLDVASTEGGAISGQEQYSSVNVLYDDSVSLSRYWTGTPIAVANGSTSLSSLKATDTFYDEGANVAQQSLKPSTQYTGQPSVIYTSPSSLDLAFTNSATGKVSYFSYSGGKYQTGNSSTAAAMTTPVVSSSYFLSPNGSNQMWSRLAGATTTIYIGNTAGANSRAIAQLDNSYVPYGWYTDQYILLNKSGVLYIMPSTGSGNQAKVQKVASFTP